MRLKVFSKRHPTQDVSLRMSVRRRIWYAMEEFDPYPYSEWTLRDTLATRLKEEHGWEELRAYTESGWVRVDNMEEFILRGVPKYVLDATELYWDLLSDHGQITSTDPVGYQAKLNTIFDDAGLPWRMLDGRILRVDSKWLEEEIHARAAELLSVRGFEGALEEFRKARSELSGGDYKEAIHAANLALESTIKSILGIDQEKPGALYRKLMESGIVPNYYEGFLQAFEEHILRSVAVARNFERGVGHGQGATVNQPPKSLAELAVNLTGVLIVYLIRRYMELYPGQDQGGQAMDEDSQKDEVPF